ncbi:MAG: tRNA(His) guanylyltransferase Thg1 family protein [Bacteroidota bacterium]|jgi:tRNA(His) 5'-end guanylyltransferase
MKKTEFQKRMKLYEEKESERKFLPLLPIMARLDGRSFHSFCRGLRKPFSPAFSGLMVEVTKYLVAETGALMGYTQSDEISLVWLSEEFEKKTFFEGRIFKVTSVLAGLATAKFNQLLPDYLPEKKKALPVFDCRVWQVPNKTEAANGFLWRQFDATRNSITGLARCHFSHAEIHGKDSREMLNMLLDKGISWSSLPPAFTHGVWLQRQKNVRPYTTEEIDKLPLKHKARTDPNLQVVRWAIIPIVIPLSFSFVTNREGVIFSGEMPRFIPELLPMDENGVLKRRTEKWET